ncbi:membrane glycoprotein UL141 [Panine betaherpesvirus 2]|uniref:Membrane glycoprotein UL141 n=1 Tax=Panine betaherpesvirus 2 TaxID=188763 RepID=Q8QRX2_9BETA|nr:membrane glycoprotein UL141 [Panine betaherpesvirus 2]AAM00765.1 membrane glycoprotein UL141 [Panine betaherpesvirus 2]QXV67879.1 membrane glycoprotein UL141 [Panine betaherpesvirus 2]
MARRQVGKVRRLLPLLTVVGMLLLEPEKSSRAGALLSDAAAPTGLPKETRAENYEIVSPAPMLVAEGERVTVPCTVMIHQWPLAVIRATFCLSPPTERSVELVFNLSRGGEVVVPLEEKLTESRLRGGVSYNFTDLHVAHLFSLTFRATASSAGVYECLLRNDSHALVLQRFVVLTHLETLSWADEPCCTPPLGRHSQDRQIWSPTPWRLKHVDCGWSSQMGFRRNRFYIEPASIGDGTEINIDAGEGEDEECWGPLCQPEEQPDRCWPVVRQYRLPGGCYRSGDKQAKFVPALPPTEPPLATPPEIPTGLSPWATRGVASFLGFWGFFSVGFVCYLIYLHCCRRCLGRRGDGYRRLPQYDEYPGHRRMKT